MVASLPQAPARVRAFGSKLHSRAQQDSTRILFALIFVPGFVYFLPGAMLQVLYLASATRNIATPPCGRARFNLGSTSHSFAGANYREITRITVGPFRRGRLPGKTLTFSVYRASGREFAIAPQFVFEDAHLRRCVVHLSQRALRILKHETSKLLRISQQNEPIWKEALLPRHMQVPHASEFLGLNPLGKLYLDEVNESRVPESAQSDPSPGADSDDLFARPLMNEQETEAWQLLAQRLNGGGRHLGIGSGPRGAGAHFACGYYSKVHAVDSVKEWCSQAKNMPLSFDQRVCIEVDSHCVKAFGSLDEFGMLRDASESRTRYGEKYLDTLDEFQGIPYFDTVLVDGRFRVASAIKALRYLRRDSILMVHDFNAARPNYRKILDYYEQLNVTGSLAFLAPRANITAREVEDFKIHQDDPV